MSSSSLRENFNTKLYFPHTALMDMQRETHGAKGRLTPPDIGLLTRVVGVMQAVLHLPPEAEGGLQPHCRGN